MSFEIYVDMFDLTRGIRNFEKVEDAVNRGIRKGIDEVADLAISQLQKNLAKYDLSGSALAQTMNVHIFDDGISISMDADYYMFVEFGTGFAGEGHPHPNPIKGNWQYDVNAHGVKGWWYPTTESDPNPHKWVDPEGTLRAWTQGEESRPFIYDTWQYVYSRAYKIVSKNINRELKSIKVRK